MIYKHANTGGCENACCLKIEHLSVRIGSDVILDDINLQSRYGSGVRVMRLAEGDRVVTVARAERDDSAETVKPEASAEDDQEDSAALKAAEAEQQESDGEE